MLENQNDNSTEARNYIHQGFNVRFSLAFITEDAAENTGEFTVSTLRVNTVGISRESADTSEIVGSCIQI